jgi:phospholipid/cholesterol/gamma-HCH transport system ATP-binding protein
MNSTTEQTAPQPPAIEFRHVSLSFDDKQALRDVSFALERGEVLALTGASGSGKSVILHLAIGLIRPDAGQIFINGREIEGLSEDDLLTIRGGLMGIVFQDEALFTGVTVYENVAFRLMEHGWAASDTEQAVREALRFVGLEADIDTSVEDLSGGMRRRVEIARAFVGWPSIMLYDEPTSGLDPINAGQVLDLIIRARDIQHISGLFVTKTLREIPYVATHFAVKDEKGEITIRDAGGQATQKMKIILLEKGEIAFVGTHEEFAESALPAVTLMTHAENGTHISDIQFADPWSKRRKPREEFI